MIVRTLEGLEVWLNAMWWCGAVGDMLTFDTE